MATVNRLRKGTKQPQPQPQPQQQSPNPNPTSMPRTRTHPTSTSTPTHTKQAQKQYEAYYELAKSNPLGVTASSSLFPHSAELNDSFNVPLAFVMSPMLVLENQVEVMGRSVDRIPRCGVCRAYLNCYDTIKGNRFSCFFCQRQSYIDKSYNPQQPTNFQLSSPIYHSLGPTNYHNKQPAEQAFVFMIDISPEAYTSKMLYYAVAAMKEVLSRTDLDDLLVYFYTYDELVHAYLLDGQEVKCVVVDSSIQDGGLLGSYSSYLKDIRDNLFTLLDSLQQLSKTNQRKGYNFTRCFNHIYTNTKHSEPKYFIFQVNESFCTEPMFTETLPNGNVKPVDPNLNATKSQSFFQTINKQFFNLYAEDMLRIGVSVAFFGFGSVGYKNYKVFNDCLKLTCSELKVYNKDCPIQLQKFYYDLSYLLGATYFKNVTTEFVISAGWLLSGVYGNYHRIKQTVTFQMNIVEQSRKIVVIVTPSPNVEKISPFCGLQVITHYQYKRQNFSSVATIVQPVTGFVSRLYDGIDGAVAITALGKKFMSILRMESINSVRKKFLQANAKIYQSALAVYKKYENFPDSVLSILMSSLAMLKSPHSHPELIDKTPIMDKITSERNILQFSGPSQMTTKFSPYLFDLSAMDETMCQEGADFVYPPTVELKFQNVRQGLFLLDNGLSLTLFIAKQCPPTLLQQTFNKPKLSKQDLLTEQLLSNQNTFLSTQILTLIKFLREQKMYGWVPLYIVRCGENTLNERNFYLNFYMEKYEEFRMYRLGFGEFVAMLAGRSGF